jgi:hypothetical protein
VDGGAACDYRLWSRWSLDRGTHKPPSAIHNDYACANAPFVGFFSFIFFLLLLLLLLIKGDLSQNGASAQA